MVNYDKTAIREALSLEDIFNLLVDFGGEPEYTSFGILSSTICHNEPGVGSRKLYYYTNSGLFHCYTGCEEPSFDLFQLVIKIQEIQHHQVYDLNMAVRWIAQRFGIAGAFLDEEGNCYYLNGDRMYFVNELAAEESVHCIIYKGNYEKIYIEKYRDYHKYNS